MEVDMLKIKILSFLGIFLLFTLAAYAAEEEPIGIVIGIQGKVIVKNSSGTFPLALKSPLAVSDTITTGFNSKVQILLRDDSAITLGEDSELELSEFSDVGVSPKFAANFVKGSLRIITGKITEANPEGFKITTQHATVGIRGTILSLHTDDQRTKLVVLNTDKTVIFNSVSVSENQWAVAERGGTPVIAPLTRQEKEDEIREMIVTPIPEPITEVGDSFAEIPDIQYTPEMPFTPNNPTPPITTTATYSGNVGNGAGEFSFDMDLQKSTISNAKTSSFDQTGLTIGNANISGVNDVRWNLSNGSGEFCANGFEVRNFEGKASNGAGGGSFDSTNTYFSGFSGTSGATITGEFQLGFYDESAGSVERINIPIDGNR
jgi:hypothetical protein